MKSKVKSAAKAPAKAEFAKKRAAKAEKPAVKKTAASGAAKMPKTAKATAKSAAKPVKAEPAAKREPKAAAKPKAEKAVKSKQPAARSRKKGKPEENVPAFKVGEAVLDPIGDTTDGEGRTGHGEFEDEAAAMEQAAQSSAEVAAFGKETRLEASDAILAAGPGMEGAQEAMETTARKEAVETAAGEEERSAEPRGPEQLERLQKILSQAGIASRRRAEEMITEGRVMVNGQVVTTLGSKADPERDHIRVDGKLLHGAERHRYFLLNKPKGFVTTVSDPEGRPTVMKFFEKMHERLYPVGRLDYQSEGLLLMTNDGELANLLTKAGSGVEKTYLVKVAGRPTEEELEKLRGGVTIERGEAGSGRVRTAPARVRQVRVGDNPWFEVVLIEGRNRELRKMFGAVGHFVEKIRRVGYGPLALDVEPGKMRELTPDEVRVLRLTAEGKMKPKRLHADRMLPKDAGMAAEKRFEKRGGRGGREFGRREGGGFGKRESGGPRRSEGGSFGTRERKDFGTRDAGGFPRREGGDSSRPESGGFRRPQGGDFRKREGGGFGRRDSKPFAARGEQGQKREFRPRNGEFRGGPRGEKRPFVGRPEGRSFGGEKRGFGGRPSKPFGAERGAGKPGEFRERPKFEGSKPFGSDRRPFGGGRPASGPKREFRSPGGDRPRFDRPKFDRARPDKPGFQKPGFEKPRFEKRSFDGPPAGKLRIEKVESEQSSFDRPRFDKPRFDKPRFDNPGFGGRRGGRPEGRQGDRLSKPFRPQGDRPGGFKRPDNPSGARPGGAGRPKTGFGGRPGGFGKTNRPGGFKRPNKPGGGRGGPRSGGGRPSGR
ncbi:MAG: pseudouridine synthase [Terracidiphilus sp.]